MAQVRDSTFRVFTGEAGAACSVYTTDSHLSRSAECTASCDLLHFFCLHVSSRCPQGQSRSEVGKQAFLAEVLKRKRNNSPRIAERAIEISKVNSRSTPSIRPSYQTWSLELDSYCYLQLQSLDLMFEISKLEHCGTPIGYNTIRDKQSQQPHNMF